MNWEIKEDRPIWIQLKEQIAKMIISGNWSSDEKLPAVRELAKEAGVNPNTMQRALAALDQEGLTVTNRTAGRMVTQDKNIIEAHRKEVAGYIMQTYLKDMKDIGIERDEAISLLKEKE